MLLGGGIDSLVGGSYMKKGRKEGSRDNETQVSELCVLFFSLLHSYHDISTFAHPYTFSHSVLPCYSSTVWTEPSETVSQVNSLFLISRLFHCFHHSNGELTVTMLSLSIIGTREKRAIECQETASLRGKPFVFTLYLGSRSKRAPESP